MTCPIDFRGHQLELTLFAVFAPLTQLGALESVARGFDLRLITITAGPCTLAGYLCKRVETGEGTLVLDIGSAATKIALVRPENNYPDEVGIVAFAGGAFIRAIASKEGIDIPEAEQLKRRYSENQVERSRREQLHEILAGGCKIESSRWSGVFRAFFSARSVGYSLRVSFSRDSSAQNVERQASTSLEREQTDVVR